MLARLLDVEGQTIARFRTLVTWLSFNEEAVMKEELLKGFDLDQFTMEELATVKKSGLYEKDQIIERMEQLYQIKLGELRAQAQEERILSFERKLAAQEKVILKYRKEVQMKEGKSFISHNFYVI